MEHRTRDNTSSARLQLVCVRQITAAVGSSLDRSARVLSRLTRQQCVVVVSLASATTICRSSRDQLLREVSTTQVRWLRVVGLVPVPLQPRLIPRALVGMGNELPSPLTALVTTWLLAQPVAAL